MSAVAKGFGSFMSAPLGELLAGAAAATRPAVELPFEADVGGLGRDPFRIDLERFTFVNHGAFGAALDVGERRAAQWRAFAEQQPLRFFDRALFPHLVESARRLAKFVNAGDVRNLALVANATTALDAVVAEAAERGGPDGRIVLLDTAYGSVKRMAARHAKGRVLEIAVPLPLSSPAALCAHVDAELYAAKARGEWPVALGVIDHISSNTALVLPIEQLTDVFHKHGAPVLVDGAHGPNAVHVDLTELKCDAYVGNCHKWLCSPKSVGFLHLREPRGGVLSEVQPRVTSHGASAPFPDRFYWDGCRDYAAALALPAVLDFWEKADAPRGAVCERNASLAASSAIRLADAWGTNEPEKWIAPRGSSLVRAPMTLVPLPDELDTGPGAAAALQDQLYHDFSIECPIKRAGGGLHARISAHLYNEPAHYERLAEAVETVRRQLRAA